MKVKSVDIARRLGLSKATVSLALNGKPGVNERTRQRVFECQGLLEKELEEAEKAARKRLAMRQRLFSTAAALEIVTLALAIVTAYVLFAA